MSYPAIVLVRVKARIIEPADWEGYTYNCPGEGWYLVEITLTNGTKKRYWESSDRVVSREVKS